MKAKLESSNLNFQKQKNIAVAIYQKFGGTIIINVEPNIDIAKNDKNPRVRKAAIDKINDQSVLVDIAKSDIDWSLRKAAFNKITDPSVLVDIAKNDRDANVRQVAIETAKEKIITYLNYSFNKLNAANNYALIIPVINHNLSNASIEYVKKKVVEDGVRWDDYIRKPIDPTLLHEILIENFIKLPFDD